MRKCGHEVLKRFLILWFPFFMIAPVFGQEGQGGSKEVAPPSEEPAAPPQAPAGTAQAVAPVNPVQNAVIEGVQLSSEPSKEPHESVVTCYFIFRDKPSSYFYEVKKKTNKLVFEFNDTQKGNSPVASQKIDPIQGFELEQGKIDVNKEVKGLNPEWHDMVTVTFSLTAIPKINVADEYNVISFSYKWSSDPGKAKALALHEGGVSAGAVVGICGGVLVVAGGLGVIAWKALGSHNNGGVPVDVDTTDLPVHQGKMW